jgi:hypothetical protein
MTANILDTPTNYNLEELKQQIFNNVVTRLGGNIIDVELSLEDLESSYAYAIKVYRQRAQNANQESYTLMTIV